MPMENNQEDVKSSGKTRGKVQSPIKTPGRRVTRRNSQLEEAEAVVEASPITRRTTRSRKNVSESVTENITTKTPIKGRTTSESHSSTPAKITRRSSSLLSADAEAPNSATIPEEAPIARRTRGSSVTSDEGNTETPTKRRNPRKSVMREPTVPEIVEENESPSRPVTRSMSKSPADIEKASTVRKEINLSDEHQMSSMNDSNTNEMKANDTIETIVKEIKDTLSGNVEHSPDLLASPRSIGQSLNTSKSSENIAEKSPIKTQIVETSLTPSKILSTPKSVSGTPGSAKSKKSDNQSSKLKTPISSQTLQEKTPESTGKKIYNNSINETPGAKIKTPKEQTPKSDKKSQSTPAKARTPKSIEKLSERECVTPQFVRPISHKFGSKTPPPVSNAAAVSPETFSKSWTQAVRSPAGGAIDQFKKENVIQLKKLNESKKKGIESETESDSDSDQEEPFINEKAEVVHGYESGDSRDEDEKEAIAENRMHEEEIGEDIGSEDSSMGEEEDYEEDSFIASEDEVELLSYSDDDEHLNVEPDTKNKGKKQRKRLIIAASSSEDEESETKNKEILNVSGEKVKSKSPKIVSSEKAKNKDDPDISCKPQNSTLFNETSAMSSTRLDMSTNQNSEEEMDIDEDNERTMTAIEGHLNVSMLSPKKQILERSLNDVKDQVSTPNLNKSKRRSKVSFLEEDQVETMNDSKMSSNEKSLTSPVIPDAMPEKSTSPKISPAKVRAAESSLLKLAQKNNRLSLPALPISTVHSTTKTNKSLNGSKSNVPITDLDEDSNDEPVDENEPELNETEMNSDSDSDDENETANRLNVSKASNVSDNKRNQVDVAVTSTSKPKVLKTPEELDAILEKCNKILSEKKEKKSLNKAIHKKEKEQKKKLKELEKQKKVDSNSDGEKKEAAEDLELKKKKKKKKQKLGRKYNQELEDGEATEEISEVVKHKLETLEKRRERKKLKKLAKLEKLQEMGIDTAQVKKDDKENLCTINENNHAEHESKPVKKKQKSLLTAVEARALLEGNNENTTKVKNKSKKQKPVLKTPSSELEMSSEVAKLQEPSKILTQNMDENKVKTIDAKTGTKRKGSDSIFIENATAKKKKNTKSEESDEKPREKPKKKSKENKRVIQQDLNQTETSPPPKQMLSILSSEGSFNKLGFVEESVTPSAERLRRNMGFEEQPVTPKPLGFKVQSMMPSGEEFVKKVNKKRKRQEIAITEPSRVPPRPIWSSSGEFEEIDLPAGEQYIPLKTGGRSATQFSIGILGKKSNKNYQMESNFGHSDFKTKHLYKNTSSMREPSQKLVKKLEKIQKFRKY